MLLKCKKINLSIICMTKTNSYFKNSIIKMSNETRSTFYLSLGSFGLFVNYEGGHSINVFD